MDWQVIVGTFSNMMVYGVLGFSILLVFFWPGLFISSFIINFPKIVKATFQGVSNINVSVVGIARSKVDKNLADD
jgi:ABC-type molybdate transport system permease subunit